MMAQSATWVEGQPEFTENMVRLRPVGQPQAHDEANGIILINSTTLPATSSAGRGVPLRPLQRHAARGAVSGIE